MIYQQIQGLTSVQAEPGQPLIGVISGEAGHEVVRYFTREQDAEQSLSANSTQEALALAGAWSDLEWKELEEGLARIRHGSPPTPPLAL